MCLGLQAGNEKEVVQGAQHRRRAQRTSKPLRCEVITQPKGGPGVPRQKGSHKLKTRQLQVSGGHSAAAFTTSGAWCPSIDTLAFLSILQCPAASSLAFCQALLMSFCILELQVSCSNT